MERRGGPDHGSAAGAAGARGSAADRSRTAPHRGFAWPTATWSPSAEARPSLGLEEIKLIGRRLAGSLLILLAIAYLTSWGLILAEYGRQHLPIEPIKAAWQALGQTAQYILNHPATYFWAKNDVPWFKLVGETLSHSAGLLLLSMSAAIILGFPLGMAAARTRRGPGSALMVMLSVAGASTPSFLMGMILWAANIWVHRTFDIKVLPATGFGWGRARDHADARVGHEADRGGGADHLHLGARSPRTGLCSNSPFEGSRMAGRSKRPPAAERIDTDP